MGGIASAFGVPLALFIGAILSVVAGVGAWLWLNRIQASRPRPALRAAAGAAVAAGDIGAIDPEGRAAGSVGRARSR